MSIIMNFDVLLTGDLKEIDYSKVKDNHIEDLKRFVRNIGLNYHDYFKSLIEFSYNEPIEESDYYLSIDTERQSEQYYGHENVNRSIKYTIEDKYADGVTNEFSIRLSIDSNGLKAQVRALTRSKDKDKVDSFYREHLTMGAWLNSLDEFNLGASYAIVGFYSHLITRSELLNNNVEVDFSEYIKIR